MKRRNPSLHGETVKPSELTSRIRGLQTRYDMNAQLIRWLRSYGQTAALLLHEYELSRAYPECCAQFHKDKRMCSEQIVALVAAQTELQTVLDDLRGQDVLFIRQEELRLANED